MGRRFHNQEVMSRISTLKGQFHKPMKPGDMMETATDISLMENNSYYWCWQGNLVKLSLSLVIDTLLSDYIYLFFVSLSDKISLMYSC